MIFIFSYLAIAAAFLALDAAWLSTMASRLYQPVLGDLLRPPPNFIAAGIFYAIYPVGLLGFATWPAHQDGSAFRALISGMPFGAFTYATYDLTNQATLRNWSTTLTVADICWGSFAAGAGALAGYAVAQRMGS